MGRAMGSAVMAFAAAAVPSCLSFLLLTDLRRRQSFLAFAPSATHKIPFSTPLTTTASFASRGHDKEDKAIVDAEFERVPTADQESDDDFVAKRFQEENDADDELASLLDFSLKADPEMANLRIPFVDGKTEQAIDAKLCFLAELDGSSYGIGIPFDPAAAITLETEGGSVVQNLSPDADDNVELMEIMATQLQEHVGSDLRLIRTPRILTIGGPLDTYTDNWQDELLPKSIPTDTLLHDEEDDSDNEDEQAFLDFMKEELGEEEFSKTINADVSFDDEVLSLFSMAGVGDREDELADFLKNEIMEDVAAVDSSKDYPKQQRRELIKVVGDLSHEGVALKLVSYFMAGSGKCYSLVKLLKPPVLIARQVTATRGAPRFELLSLEEYRLVAPRLEDECRADLERIGLQM